MDAARALPPVRTGPGSREFRYGAVVLLVIAGIVFAMTGPSDDAGAVVGVLLSGTTLLLTLAVARVGRRTWLVGSSLIGLSVVAVVLLSLVGGTRADGVARFVTGMLVVSAPPVILWSLRSVRRVDVSVVLGAIAIYLLLGLLFATVYGGVGKVSAQSFFAQRAEASSTDYTYFSFVTLTTTGYGDLTAATALGRTLAILEALLGQLYLVTVVALLVANLGRTRTVASRAAEEPPA